MLFRCITTLAVLISFAPMTPASAWGINAHRAICTIAWEDASGATRAKISDILGIATPGAFVEVCADAETILRDRAEAAAWQAITLPQGARAIDLARDCPEVRGCSVRAVEYYAAVLGSDAPKAAQAEAIIILSNLVAMLHQPLHIAFAGARTGQQVSGMFMARPTNLFLLWESGLVETLAPPGSDPVPTIVKAATWTGRLYGADKKTPLEWANETLWVTVSPATGFLGNPGGDFFDDRYIRQNRPVALEQIDKAGVRLAELIARRLGTEE